MWRVTSEPWCELLLAEHMFLFLLLPSSLLPPTPQLPDLKQLQMCPGLTACLIAVKLLTLSTLPPSLRRRSKESSSGAELVGSCRMPGVAPKSSRGRTALPVALALHCGLFSVHSCIHSFSKYIPTAGSHMLDLGNKTEQNTGLPSGISQSFRED